jgi:hypothetical protein
MLEFIHRTVENEKTHNVWACVYLHGQAEEDND